MYPFGSSIFLVFGPRNQSAVSVSLSAGLGISAADNQNSFTKTAKHGLEYGFLANRNESSDAMVFKPITVYQLEFLYHFQLLSKSNFKLNAGLAYRSSISENPNGFNGYLSMPLTVDYRFTNSSWGLRLRATSLFANGGNYDLQATIGLTFSF